MSKLLDLPDYKDLEPELRARMDGIYERPVVLSVEHLGRIFEGNDGPVEALKDVNFKVHRREFICIIGQSGCGKSTLIRILAGLGYPTSGVVTLDGEPIDGPSPDRGMVFQQYTLFPWLTVKENVMFGMKMRGASTAIAEPMARQWIDLVGLGKFSDAYPHELSGGMRQRVAIVRALANRPRILLMDEPFGALDAQTRSQMQEHLLQIWKNVDVTILFITHDLDEAVYLSDRVLVLSAHPGQVAEIVEVPLARPRTPELSLDPYFIATKRRLEELVHPTHDHADDALPIVKMTVVGDDVE
ncbi:MAG: NitT/TauT family transport system ATP-binding protein [Rhodothermales bacterium]|jgi:NitT/TauT family transport system ATP-binding protein